MFYIKNYTGNRRRERERREKKKRKDKRIICIRYTATL